MPAKRIAGMARSYRYLQADRRNCLQFAARQRGVWTTGDLLSNNPYIIDFMGYDVFCRRGRPVFGGALPRSKLGAQGSRP